MWQLASIGEVPGLFGATFVPMKTKCLSYSTEPIAKLCANRKLNSNHLFLFVTSSNHGAQNCERLFTDVLFDTTCRISWHRESERAAGVASCKKRELRSVHRIPKPPLWQTHSGSKKRLLHMRKLRPKRNHCGPRTSAGPKQNRLLLQKAAEYVQIAQLHHTASGTNSNAQEPIPFAWRQSRNWTVSVRRLDGIFRQLLDVSTGRRWSRPARDGHAIISWTLALRLSQGCLP